MLTPINTSKKSESMDFASAVAIDSDGKYQQIRNSKFEVRN